MPPDGGMKVLRLHGRRDVRVSEEPRPEIDAGSELVRVTCVGICGSDLHWYEEGGIGDAHFSRPLVLGHEPAGVIEDGPRKGIRVAIDPAVACGRCSFCAEGNPNLCSNLRFAGHGSEDGAFREMMVWPSSSLVPVPDVLSDREIAMLEPLGVAIHAVDLGKVRPGDTVAVFGCGPIGLLIMQVALVAGAACVVVTDRFPHRLEAARRLGATATVLAGEDGEAESVWEATGGEGAAVSLEAATENAAVESAIASARPGGRVVLVGIPDDDRTSFSASAARRKGLTIKLARRMKHTYPRAVKQVVDKTVDVASIVSHRFTIDRGAEAFDVASRRNGLKVVIEPT
ncbi:MAG: alcohol dehydrogenase catalytic domain-containing protein [Rhodothermales bacterium]|nr:alcohol dehydrogenase catalytic domain-containing protein [Rhodothermales bacterium]